MAKFAAGVLDTGGKFATIIIHTNSNFGTGVVDTGAKIRRQCRWYRWCTLTCEYLRKCSEKIQNGPNGILWGSGELIHEKNQKQKILNYK